LATFRRAFHERFGYPHRRRSVAGKVAQLRLTPEELLALVPVLGSLGLAHEKEIPYCLINAPRHQVERFLGLYFCADGWADRSGAHFGSKSKGVCLALKRMLLRCGIVSNLHLRVIRGHSTHWTLSIADKGQAKAFTRVVEPHLTQAKSGKVSRWLAEWSDGASATNIGIPSSFLVAELEQMHLGDRRFDTIFAVRVGLFHREPERARALAERWLAPGGRLHAVFDPPR
jgi:hypothetical protein